MENRRQINEPIRRTPPHVRTHLHQTRPTSHWIHRNTRNRSHSVPNTRNHSMATHQHRIQKDRSTQQGNELMTHKYTKEILYHYTCGQCGHWWSYAHTQHKYDLTYPQWLKKLTCPHCAHTTTCEEKDGAYPNHETTGYHRASKPPSWGTPSKGWQPDSKDFL